MVKIPQHIKTLQPYVAGKPIAELAREKHLSRIVKLASNENPLGPSPRALEAIRQSLGEIHRYVDPGSYELVQKLSAHYRIKPERVICGAGIDALLSYAIKTFTEEGDEVLTAAGTFIGIYVNTNKHNRGLSLVPLKSYHYDLPAIADAVTPRTRIIYLANPNNPTGTMFTTTEFEQFMARVPAEIVVILDEAYCSYAVANAKYPNGLNYDYPNLIVMRTFSKDYGLAGLRVGFAAGAEPLIREMYKVKLPFEPGFSAQQAAMAALDDDPFLQRTIQLNRRCLSRMAQAFSDLGIEQIPSDTNFILLLLPSEQIAAEFNQLCLDRGLIVRHVKSFGLPNGIRINSGTDDETSFALQVVDDVYHQLLKSYPFMTPSPSTPTPR